MSGSPATLRRYVESIGGKLEFVALFGDEKITLAVAQLLHNG